MYQVAYSTFGSLCRVGFTEDELTARCSQSVQVNATLSRMNEVLETTNQLQSRRIELTEEKMDTENNRTNKYHSSVLLLFQNFASYDREVAALDPAESILAVLNCDSHGKAEKSQLTNSKTKDTILFVCSWNKQSIPQRKIYLAQQRPSYQFQPLHHRRSGHGCYINEYP